MSQRIKLFAFTAFVVLALGGGLAFAETKKDEKAAAPTSNWAVRCTDPKKTKEAKSCEAFSRLAKKDTKQMIAELAVGENNGKLNLVAVAPLGVKLSDGAVLRVDGKDLSKMPFQTCVNVGCVARMDLSNDLRQKIASSKDITLSIIAMNGKPVNIGMSPLGFSAALDRAKQEAAKK